MTAPKVHEKYIGVSDEYTPENLQKLDALVAAVILRFPRIPTVSNNPAHFAGIAALANRHSCILEIHVQSYHSMGNSKLDMLVMEYPLVGIESPSGETSDLWVAEIAAMTKVPVK